MDPVYSSPNQVCWGNTNHPSPPSQSLINADLLLGCVRGIQNSLYTHKEKRKSTIYVLTPFKHNLMLRNGRFFFFLTFVIPEKLFLLKAVRRVQSQKGSMKE